MKTYEIKIHIDVPDDDEDRDAAYWRRIVWGQIRNVVDGAVVSIPSAELVEDE